MSVADDLYHCAREYARAHNDLVGTLQEYPGAASDFLLETAMGNGQLMEARAFELARLVLRSMGCREDQGGMLDLPTRAQVARLLGEGD